MSRQGKEAGEEAKRRVQAAGFAVGLAVCAAISLWVAPETPREWLSLVAKILTVTVALTAAWTAWTWWRTRRIDRTRAALLAWGGLLLVLAQVIQV